ncbi:Uncharacterised protein [Raoultella terrigena]|uniref:Uncharacterized protein n=1 Tax=Raoultella terrigena TaxID=577 RepID=A0A3P8K6D8_RAOTE|nr:Uncharacterised protein [Raoultella terrigena]
MTLPKRLYFTLDKAASEVGCDIADIIHYAANGYVNVCIKCISQDNAFSEEPLPGWSTDLGIDVQKFHNWIGEYFVLKDMEYSLTPEGDFLAQDHTVYELVNNYLKVRTNIKFWVEKESEKIWKYEVVPVSIKGLLQIPFRWIYNSEFSLLDGASILIKAFQVPRDNLGQPVVGRFAHDNALFHTDFVADENLLNDNLANAVLGCGPRNIIKRDEPIKVDLNDFLITVDEINRLKGIKRANGYEGFDVNYSAQEASDIDNPKSIAVYAELIVSLISMIPDMKNVDASNIPPVKLKEMLSIAASKNGVVFPNIHPQTLAKYLGRGRSSR